MSQMLMASREATLESLAKLQSLGVRYEVIQNMESYRSCQIRLKYTERV
jgi:hypothetical protein